MMFASLDLKTVVAFSEIEKTGFSEALNSLLTQAFVSPDSSEALNQTKLRLFCTRRGIIMFCAMSWFCYIAVFECHFHLL